MSAALARLVRLAGSGAVSSSPSSASSTGSERFGGRPRALAGADDGAVVDADALPAGVDALGAIVCLRDGLGPVAFKLGRPLPRFGISTGAA